MYLAIGEFNFLLLFIVCGSVRTCIGTIDIYLLSAAINTTYNGGPHAWAATSHAETARLYSEANGHKHWPIKTKNPEQKTRKD